MDVLHLQGNLKKLKVGTDFEKASQKDSPIRVANEDVAFTSISLEDGT